MSPDQPRSQFWLSLTAGILLLVAGVLLSRLPAMAASLTWPSVPGTITSRTLVGQKFQEYDGDYYLHIEGYLHYAYAVDGVGYDSTAVNALDSLTCSEQTARKYPEGSQVLVYYDPHDPARSVLEPGFVLSGKAFGLGSSFLCGAGVYLLALSWWRRSTGRRSILRGWPDEDATGRGIGMGIGRQ